MAARVFFGLRLFERLQDLVSDRHGVCKTLQSRRELFEFVVAEVTVSNAGRQDEVIVWETNPFAICVAHEDILLILVHSGDFSENDGCIPLLAQDSADRGSNLTWCQYRRCHLIKQRLKEVVVGPVDHNNFGRGISQSPGGGQPAETAADDHDSWLWHDLSHPTRSAASEKPTNLRQRSCRALCRRHLSCSREVRRTLLEERCERFLGVC